MALTPHPYRLTTCFRGGKTAGQTPALHRSPDVTGLPTLGDGRVTSHISLRRSGSYGGVSIYDCGAISRTLNCLGPLLRAGVA